MVTVSYGYLDPVILARVIRKRYVLTFPIRLRHNFSVAIVSIHKNCFAVTIDFFNQAATASYSKLYLILLIIPMRFLF
jgi:hypothetical protein